MSKIDKETQKKLRIEKRNHFISTIKQLVFLEEGKDKHIQMAVIALVCFGTFMIVSTNVGRTSLDNSMVVLKTLFKQCVVLIISYGLMKLANAIFNLRRFSSGLLLMSIAILFCGSMILPFFFSSAGGSHAWIRLPGGMTIQPSEFGKPLTILLVAVSVYRAKKIKTMQESGMAMFRLPLIVYGCLTILLLLQKDLGTLAITSVTFYSCLIIPKYPGIRRFQIYLKRLVFVGVCFVAFLGLTKPGIELIKATPFYHLATRIENAKDPYNDIYGEGYQPANALYGIASSNIKGKGIGQSNRKYGYLTQADNDYILAVTMEETGIFGLAFIVFFYGVIWFKLFQYGYKTKKMPYKIILTGTAVYMFMHFFLNVGGVTAMIPFTGVPLLFISSGGSSLMAIAITIGICQRCIADIRKTEMGEDI